MFLFSFEKQERIKEYMLRNPLIGTFCIAIVIAIIVVFVYCLIRWYVLTITLSVSILTMDVPFIFLMFLWGINFAVTWYYFYLTAKNPGYFLERFGVHTSEKYQYLCVGMLQLIAVIVSIVITLNTDDVFLCRVMRFCISNEDRDLYGMMIGLSSLIFLFYLHGISKIFMSKYV